MKSRHGGFTLLEVMIAITIFAMLATTVSQVASVTVDNQIHLERKMVASWIAENKIIELRLSTWDKIKKSSEDVKMSDREWVVKVAAKDVKDFPLPIPLREVNVSVALKATPDSILQSFVVYIADV